MGVPTFTFYETANGEARTLEHPALKQTDAEKSAGVTPVNYAYAPGYVRRFNAVSTSGTESSQAAFQATIDGAEDGDTIILSPTGAGKYYYLTDELSTGNKRLFVEGNGATIKWDVATANKNLFNCGTGGITVRNLQVIGTRTSGGDNELYGHVVRAAGSAFGTFGQPVLIDNVHMTAMAGAVQAKWVRQIRVEHCSSDSMVSDGNGVAGYYQACASVIVDAFVQRDASGTYFVHVNNDGSGNHSDVVVLRDCRAATYPSIRYADRVTIWGGKYHKANEDGFSGAILITNATDTVELHGVDARGADGNTNLGGVVRITDGAGRVKIFGGTFRCFDDIGDGISINGYAPDTEIIIDGAVVIDEDGTNPNSGIHVEPGSDGTIYRGYIKAVIEGFAQGYFSYPSSTGLTVSVKSRNATSRSIFLSGLAAGEAKTELLGCDVDGTIELGNVKNAKVTGGYAHKVILDVGADGASCRGVTLRPKGNTDPTISVAADDCIVALNDLEANGAGSTGGSYAISVASGADDAQIIGNNCRNFSQTNARGIRSAGANAFITGNKIDGCKGGLQTVAGGSYATPGDNMITNSGTDGDTIFAGTDLSATKLF